MLPTNITPIKISSIPKFISDPKSGTFQYPDKYVSTDEKLILFELNSQLVYFDKASMHSIDDPLIHYVLNNSSNVVNTVVDDTILTEKINKFESKLNALEDKLNAVETKLGEFKSNSNSELTENSLDVIKKLIITAITNTNKNKSSNFEIVHQLIKDFNAFKNETIDMITSLSGYQESTYNSIKELQDKSENNTGYISETTLLHLVKMMTNGSDNLKEITIVKDT